MKKKHFLTALTFMALLTGCANPGDGGQTENPPSTDVDSDEAKEYDITLNTSKEVKAKLLVGGKEVTKAKKGETVTLTLEFSDKYKLKALTSNDVSFTTVTEGVTYTFVMVDKAVTINIQSEYVKTISKIKIICPSEVETKILVGEKEVTEALEGETVKITLKINDSYALKSISSNEVEFQMVSDGEEYTFIMPDKEVNISIEIEYIKVTSKININSSKETNVTLLVDNKEVTEALEGALVTVKLSFIEKYVFDSIKSDEVEFKTVKDGEEYTFIMPRKEVNIEVKAKYVKQVNKISVSSSEEVNAKLLVNDEEVSEALEGVTVTLLLEVKEKYIVSEVTSLDTTLNVVEEGKKYTFVMPDKAVHIDIKSEYVKQIYNILSIREYTSYEHEIVGIAAHDKVLEGDKVSFTYNAIESSTKKYVAFINQQKISGETKEGKTLFTFEMPSEDIEVVVVEETISSTDPDNSLKVTYNESTDNSFTVYGITNGAGYKFKNYETLPVYIIPKKGYTLKVEYSMDGGSYRNQSATSGVYKFYIYNAKETFDIRITSEFVGVKKVTFNNSINVDIVGELEYTPGDKVKLIVNGKNGYTVTGIEKTETDDETISLRPTFYSGEITFTMPKANVSITLKVVKSVSLKAESNDKIDSLKFLTSKDMDKEGITSALPGEKVYIYALPISGYKITKVLYGENLECKYDPYWDGTPYYSFTIPEGDEVTIRFEVAELKKFSYETNSEVYKISNINETEFAIGEKVEFSLKAKVGYEITNVKLSDETIKITHTEDTLSTYSFIMPDKDVSLIVEHNVLETGILIFNKTPEIKYATFRNIDDNNININSGDKLNKGTKVSAEFALSNGFAIKEVKLSNGTSLTINEETGLYEFVMPSGEVTIELSFEETPKNSLTIDTFDGVVTVKGVKDNGYTVNVNEDGTFNGYLGSEITVELSIKDSHYFDFDAFKVIGLDGTEIKATVTELFSSVKVTFTMPSQGVKLIPTVKEYVFYNINKTGEHQGQYKLIKGSIYTGEEVSTAKKGEKINVKLNMTSEEFAKYSSVTVKVIDDITNEVLLDKKFSSKSDYWSFTMPDNTVTVEVIGTI